MQRLSDILDANPIFTPSTNADLRTERVRIRQTDKSQRRNAEMRSHARENRFSLAEVADRFSVSRSLVRRAAVPSPSRLTDCSVELKPFDQFATDASAVLLPQLWHPSGSVATRQSLRASSETSIR